MHSKDIRKKFFNFFKDRGHMIVDSSSLIPAQDPTLLFTNAGMNQFKDAFLGLETRSYKKAVTIQKCMRAGGKHNDLDNVGFTKRHLTFFEMMGNFSFGDYFKKDAIRYAWDFLTKDLGLDPAKLWVSVFRDDNEAYDIWNKEVGVDECRIVRLGEKDNFWQMGDVGPCGPCTEIYVDRGALFGCGSSSCAPGCDCDRFLEVWNNVFMQFDRQVDGTLVPLKQTGVDTGMGLERITSIIQNKDSVYETDLFAPIINKIESLTGLKYYEQDYQKKAAFNVLCDHIRASVMLISDGCAPSNEGRGYVLRKIIRRAALFERKISETPIFVSLADVVVQEMGDIYPDIKNNKDLIKGVLTSEVEKFHTNLIRGTALLEKYISSNSGEKNIPGEEVFKLYDTYGFPVEVTELIAREHGFDVDREGFVKYMDKQKALSGKKMVKKDQDIVLPENATTKFIGYESLEIVSPVVAILNLNDEIVDRANKGDEVWFVTKESPFFVACGGQVDDVGFVEFNGNRSVVVGIRKIDKAIALKIKSTFDFKANDALKLVVDSESRINTMKNHTATHLLQAALIEILGKQVKQSGSVVTPEYLRFDFTYHKNLTDAEIKQVEDRVNLKIRENIPTQIYETDYKKAVNDGVIAIFGEKYNPECVRVVRVPGFSAELCGGTHVPMTGDIGTFKITQETALSAGNRRIFALTGPKAIDLYQELYTNAKILSQDFKVKPSEIVEAVEKQKEAMKSQATKLNVFKKLLVDSLVDSWISSTRKIGSYSLTVVQISEFEPSDLKDIAAKVHSKLESIVLVINKSARYSFIVSLPSTLKGKIDLKALSADLSASHGLKSGGSDIFIQGSAEKMEPGIIEASIIKLK